MAGEMDDDLPDARDGLTRRERVVLQVLHEAQKEFEGRRRSPTIVWRRSSMPAAAPVRATR